MVGVRESSVANLAPASLPTEVADVRPAFDVDENVRWLEVAMQNTLLMGFGDRPGDRREQLGRDTARQRPLSDSIGQRRAAHVAHGEVGKVFVLANVVDGHDVGMIQLRGGFRFATKAREVGPRCGGRPR